MSIALPLDEKKISKMKALSKEIADEIQGIIDLYTSKSVERAILRLYGVDGVDKNGTPLCNIITDQLFSQNLLHKGVSRYFSAAMLKTNRNPQITAEILVHKGIPADVTAEFTPKQISDQEKKLSELAVQKLDQSRERKLKKQEKSPLPPMPWKYLIVATGNIYEDRVQAISAVESGADIIAVIRSTAQSLLDYVPFGATTEGFGGTFATQANFKIMREALDEVSAQKSRYIQLVNYSSGLCMAEIAACAALEDLDMLLNDSMYGILFRDINSKRTFVDQHFSRLICSRAKIIINTGEDNYLTTADAIDSAHTVTASQLINEAMAKNSMLTEDLLGLGHAFEINPEIENSFLFELSHALLARHLFPNSPLKYMPPTKHKSTDIFFSHCLDTLFNLTSITTKQGIHLAGILTEAIHTPLMQDRYKALGSINYCFNAAKNLGDEIIFKGDGIIVNRANQVLDETLAMLERVKSIGLIEAIGLGLFADIKRPIERGKGLDGVILKDSSYTNPIMDCLTK
jgi:beta-lysine 5,6-aminomutase alpha subunit